MQDEKTAPPLSNQGPQSPKWKVRLKLGLKIIALTVLAVIAFASGNPVIGLPAMLAALSLATDFITNLFDDDTNEEKPRDHDPADHVPMGPIFDAAITQLTEHTAKKLPVNKQMQKAAIPFLERLVKTLFTHASMDEPSKTAPTSNQELRFNPSAPRENTNPPTPTDPPATIGAPSVNVPRDLG